MKYIVGKREISRNCAHFKFFTRNIDVCFGKCPKNGGRRGKLSEFVRETGGLCECVCECVDQRTLRLLQLGCQINNHVIELLNHLENQIAQYCYPHQYC